MFSYEEAPHSTCVIHTCVGEEQESGGTDEREQARKNRKITLNLYVEKKLCTNTLLFEHTQYKMSCSVSFVQLKPTFMLLDFVIALPNYASTTILDFNFPLFSCLFSNSRS